MTRASACNRSICGRLGWLMVVNLRCVEDLDVDALEVEKFDGRSY